MLDDLLDPRGAEILPAVLEAIEVSVALGEIEREVAGRLEDAQFARALARDPARRDHRHGAVGELDARVRDVDMRRENRHAGRAHLAHLGAHQLENEIEIVNHEIEDYRHVGAARLERGQTLGLQIARLLEIRHRRAHRPIEALDVPHLERHPVLTRRMHQLFRARQRVGERFLDQRGQPTLQHRQADLDMRRCRHDHRRRFHAVEQRVERRIRGRAKLRGHLRGAGRIEIVDADQLGPVDLLQQPGVMKAKRTRSNDPDSHALHTITPRCDASMKRRKVSTSATWGAPRESARYPGLP